MMKKMTILAVILVAAVVMPGCNFTAAQLTGWLGGTSGLAGLAIDAFWDLNVTPTLNPDGKKIEQTFIDLAENVTIQLTTNSIQQNIPLDPGSIK